MALKQSGQNINFYYTKFFYGRRMKERNEILNVDCAYSDQFYMGVFSKGLPRRWHEISDSFAWKFNNSEIAIQ
jgi:hypothetical protein